MKHLLFLPVIAIVCLSSCSTYKNTQTPDDVYYSPGAPQAEADYYSQPQSQGDYYSVAPSDQYVRLKAQDPAKWSYFDNYYDEAYSPYYSGGFSPYSGFGLSLGFGSFGYSPFSYWNSYYAWNSYYNPYYYGTVIIADPKLSSPVAYTRLRPFSGGSYATHPTRANNSYVPYSRPAQYGANTPSGFGNSMRRFFSTGSNGNTNSNGSVRTYSPSSFSGGGGHVGGGGGGGGHVSIGRPGR